MSQRSDDEILTSLLLGQIELRRGGRYEGEMQERSFLNRILFIVGEHAHLIVSVEEEIVQFHGQLLFWDRAQITHIKRPVHDSPRPVHGIDDHIIATDELWKWRFICEYCFNLSDLFVSPFTGCQLISTSTSLILLSRALVWKATGTWPGTYPVGSVRISSVFVCTFSIASLELRTNRKERIAYVELGFKWLIIVLFEVDCKNRIL